jgi:hypothetical protein
MEAFDRSANGKRPACQEIEDRIMFFAAAPDVAPPKGDMQTRTRPEHDPEGNNRTGNNLTSAALVLRETSR